MFIRANLPDRRVEFVDGPTKTVLFSIVRSGPGADESVRNIAASLQESLQKRIDREVSFVEVLKEFEVLAPKSTVLVRFNERVPDEEFTRFGGKLAEMLEGRDVRVILVDTSRCDLESLPPEELRTLIDRLNHAYATQTGASIADATSPPAAPRGTGAPAPTPAPAKPASGPARASKEPR